MTGTFIKRLLVILIATLATQSWAYEVYMDMEQEPDAETFLAYQIEAGVAKCESVAQASYMVAFNSTATTIGDLLKSSQEAYLNTKTSCLAELSERIKNEYQAN